MIGIAMAGAISLTISAAIMIARALFEIPPSVPGKVDLGTDIFRFDAK